MSTRVKPSIAEQRLWNQCIAAQRHKRPEDLVEWLGAVQAQEYHAAKWALALRMSGRVTDADVERAFNEGRILRTHVMRPTWHFVTPADIRWMLALTAPRVGQALAYANKFYELDVRVRNRATTIFERVVSDGQHPTRQELGTALARKGLVLKGVRLALVTVHAELEGVICSGPQRGTKATYALLAERAPRARSLPRDEALAELTSRYVRSHGPATIRDFTWWSGLTVSDAKRGLEMAGARRLVMNDLTYWSLNQKPVGRTRRHAHLLPIYDELLVAYRDLDAMPRDSAPGTRLAPAVVVGDRVVGTWKYVPKGDLLVFAETPRTRLGTLARLSLAVRCYERFLGRSVHLRH